MESSHTKHTLPQTTQNRYVFLLTSRTHWFGFCIIFATLKTRNNTQIAFHLQVASWGTFRYTSCLFSRAPLRPLSTTTCTGVFHTLCCTLTPYYVCLIGIWVESRLRAQQSRCVSPQICFFSPFFFFSSALRDWGGVAEGGAEEGWQGGCGFF